MTTASRVASAYLKQADDPCRPGATSAAWISPDGGTHMIPSYQVHADWAEEYLRKNDPTFNPRENNAQHWLLDKGWVRVSNFMNIEVAAHHPSEAAMQATVDIVIGCVHQRHTKPDQKIYLGWGYSLHVVTIEDFVIEWGGKKAEERLFEKMASMCDEGETSAAWVSPKGEVHPLTYQSHEAWAHAYLIKSDPGYISECEAYRTPATEKWLLQRGWVRVSNFLNLEISSTPSVAAMRAVVDLVVDCAAHDAHTNPETAILYLGMGTHTKRIPLSKFVRDWGGKADEEKLFQKMAKDMCDPGEVSAAWVSPKGEIFRMTDGEYHDKWAEDYLEKDEKYQQEWEDAWIPPGQFLVEQGWVRIHNYLNIDTSKHLPSNAAMKSTVEVVMECALHNPGISPRVPFYVGMGDSTKQMRLSDFLHQWGGRSDEDRFFSTRKASMTRYVPLFVPLRERVFPVAQKPNAVWWWRVGEPTEQSRPNGQNALLEHEGHDWKWGNGTLKYSGVGHTTDGWLLLQYGAGDDAKKCPSCGKDIPEVAKFCPMCGSKTASSQRVADAWLARQATKTPGEREDEEAERLIRKSPKLKPPRDDSKRERMDTEPKEPRDKDLSLNYKDV